MKRPEFTREQEDWLCEVIGDWYLHWKKRIVPGGGLHYLGIAKEHLKIIVCDESDFIKEAADIMGSLIREKDDNET